MVRGDGRVRAAGSAHDRVRGDGRVRAAGRAHGSGCHCLVLNRTWACS